MSHRATRGYSAVERFEATDGFRVRWIDEAGATPVTAVVTAVADLNECDPLTLPPLYESVDPESLNELFDPEGSNAVDRLTFHYCGYEVVLTPTTVTLETPATN